MRIQQHETDQRGRREISVWLTPLLALLATPAHAAGDLVLIPELDMLGVMIALFVLLIFPVNALIFKPIFHALDERAGRISGARSRAKHIDAEATEVLDRYEGQIREARVEAEATRKEQIAGARSEQRSVAAGAREQAEARIEQARMELERSLEDARAGLRASSEELARTAAEQILGRAL
jgi:F-type H+-transporting ATPase subunit b